MFFIRIVLLFLVLFGHAHSDGLINNIMAGLAKAQITQGQFHQEKRLKFLKQPLVSTGTFTYHQNKGVIWKTLTPITSVLLLNESHLVSEEGEQNLPAAFGKVFKALLGGELVKLSENFTITGIQQKKSWQLTLTPKDEMLKKVMSSIHLNGDSELRALEMQETGGNLTKIEFIQITHPVRLTLEQQTDFEHISP